MRRRRGIVEKRGGNFVGKWREPQARMNSPGYRKNPNRGRATPSAGGRREMARQRAPFASPGAFDCPPRPILPSGGPDRPCGAHTPARNMRSFGGFGAGQVRTAPRGGTEALTAPRLA